MDIWEYNLAHPDGKLDRSLMSSFAMQILKPTKEVADLSQSKSKDDKATAETVEAGSIKTVMTLKAYFCCLNSL